MVESTTTSNNTALTGSGSKGKAGAFKDKQKPVEVRLSNIIAGKGIFT